MISPEVFFNELISNGVTKFSGVPDSLLKNFCAYVSDHSDPCDHVITANEGSAIALATGQYIASGQPSLVYLQNSGFGNTINPLLSLADPLVYGVPMLLMIGWRGEPGVSDEPQHIKQGAVTEALLDACEIPYWILGPDEKDLPKLIENIMAFCSTKKRPVVLLVRKNTFKPYMLEKSSGEVYVLSREDAIEEVITSCRDSDLFVSTTGMASRELFEIRVKNNQSHDRDFLTVGSMGHASMIALGLAHGRPDKRVVCIDGDGSSLMHLGNLTSIGQSGNVTFIHVVLNNGAHDSVGGQPTCALEVDLPKIAKSCGYVSVFSISDLHSIAPILQECEVGNGPYFIEIKIKKGARKNLGRPTSSPGENIQALMGFIGN